MVMMFNVIPFFPGVGVNVPTVTSRISNFQIYGGFLSMRFTKGVSWRRSFLSIAVLISILAVACGASEPQAPAQAPAQEPAAAPAAPEQPAAAMEQPAEAPAVPTDARALTETRQFESTPTPEAAMAAATATPAPTPTPRRCLYGQRHDRSGNPGRTNFTGNIQ